MIDVVLIFNGLGNQMSQYAFYLAKKKHSALTIPVYFDNEGLSHNGYELNRIFDIDIKSDNHLHSFFRNWYIKYLQKGKVFFATKSFCHIISERVDYSYEDSMLKENPLGINYYWGGWHSEKYFSEIENDIRKLYAFNEKKINEHSLKWAKKIRESRSSCSIHVRRGDYLAHPYFNGIATEAYYKKAIETLLRMRNEQEFFVFSDDIQWCRSLWGDNHFHYIDCNIKNDSWQDMYLMSICQNHINANSTFSWWGAWLSSSKDSVTIVPNRFTSMCETPDFYPEKWIKL